MKYKILQHERIEKLEEDVQKHLNLGWRPHGSLRVINPNPDDLRVFYYIQPVILK